MPATSLASAKALARARSAMELLNDNGDLMGLADDGEVPPGQRSPVRDSPRRATPLRSPGSRGPKGTGKASPNVTGKGKAIMKKPVGCPKKADKAAPKATAAA